LNVAAAKKPGAIGYGEPSGVLGSKCSTAKFTKTGTKPEVCFSPSRDGDIQHSVADISKVRNVLSYEPGVNLKEGLERLISVECDHIEEAKETKG